MNKSLSAKPKRPKILRQEWAKGIDSGPASDLDFAAIKRKARSRLKRRGAPLK